MSDVSGVVSGGAAKHATMRRAGRCTRRAGMTELLSSIEGCMVVPCLPSPNAVSR